MEKQAYVIHYDDSTYFVLDFTPEDYSEIEHNIRMGHSHAVVSFGILKLTNVKAILEWVEPKQEEEYDPKEGDPANMDPQTRAYLSFLREQEKENGGDDE